jgi:hypothetical protein
MQIKNFMKICSVEAKLFHLEGLTDKTEMTKANTHSLQSCEHA